MSNGFQQLGTVDTLVATFHNYGGADIPANTVVLPDAANPPTGDYAGGVIVPLTSTTLAGLIAGVTVETLKAGRSGPVRLAGISIVTADGAIAFGQAVQASITSGKLGRAKACGAATPQFGFALAPAADGDILPVFHAPASNA